ncbi:CPBP family intramembrane glutamic endopeptidase [Pseudomonas versuta]|jgi:CAAX amino terminal protease family.|uniref:CAAX protease family protein n=1 Tax=Pseudomonas versuta TaxID=1788301 RepID=A0A0M4QPL4_9PSED|nr:type II CAAX endopeptidase family protein [Pseudomonas versuta]ALE87640.1 CAAX protease [Pseudomonas versuta]OKA20359.1 CAAX protease family protein [Pseudomonas versuta]OKA28131.1 CAAX protease family protein [Pseudomonas versuta]
MIALPWPYLAFLTLGYCLALSYGQLGAQALIALFALILSGLAARQHRQQWLRYAGHALFVLLALALALHWLPGFHNGRAINPERLTPDAVPFSLYLNLDKPLIGFWLLLVCPWIAPRFSWRVSFGATLMALVLVAIAALGGAMLLGMITWAPKWPAHGWIWVLNNLLLVTLVEEALFRGYIQGSLSRWFKQLPYGQTLALVIAALLFGLAHMAAGWHWVLLSGIAGLGYGLAWRFGGLSAAIATHFGLNLLHFVFFTYPMLAP